MRRWRSSGRSSASTSRSRSSTSPYRELTPAIVEYLDDLDDRWNDDIITVIIPEFVAGRLLSPTQLLHNQSAGALKVALLFRENTIVTSVPYHVGSEPVS